MTDKLDSESLDAATPSSEEVTPLLPIGNDATIDWPAPIAMDDNKVYPEKSMEGWIIINGPPNDARCEACGKHVTELLPFGGPGDPLVGDFRGAKLVKTFRACWKPAENEEEIKEISDRIRQEEPGLTEEEYEAATDEIASGGTVGSIWLCRDCIKLDENQIAEKWSQQPDVRESKEVDRAIEKEATAVLVAMPHPPATIGDPNSERNLPIKPFAYHFGSQEYYTYQLKEVVESEQIRAMQAAGWELLFVRAVETYFGHRPTGNVEIRLTRNHKVSPPDDSLRQ